MPDEISYLPLLQTAVGAAVGLWGVAIGQSWTGRRDDAKRRLEFAENALAKVYEIVEAIRQVRLGADAPERLRRPKRNTETPRDSARLDMAYAPRVAITKREKTFAALSKLKFKYRAMFRNDTPGPFEILEEVKRKILLSSDILASYYYPRIGDNPFLIGGRSVSQQEYDQFNKDLAHHQKVIRFAGDPDPLEGDLSLAVRLAELNADKAAADYRESGGSIVRWWSKIATESDRRFQRDS
jgi:hypothetical protein